MASMSLCLFGAVVGLRIADFTIGLTSVLGVITLLGMSVRNVILMYQHAEDKRKVCHWSGRLAAYDAGKRRMVPIFQMCIRDRSCGTPSTSIRRGLSPPISSCCWTIACVFTNASSSRAKT